MLQTALTRGLLLRHPVVHCGLDRSCDAERASAVANAGALGALGTIGRLPEDLRAQIQRTRSRTRGPFAVNLVSYAWSPLLQEHVAVACEERVPAVVLAFGEPLPIARRCQEAGCRVLVQVDSVAEAAAAAAAAVDGLLVDAFAGRARAAASGGLGLLTRVLAAAPGLPVVVGGNPASGRVLAAALAAGAAGIATDTFPAQVPDAARLCEQLVADAERCLAEAGGLRAG